MSGLRPRNGDRTFGAAILLHAGGAWASRWIRCAVLFSLLLSALATTAHGQSSAPGDSTLSKPEEHREPPPPPPTHIFADLGSDFVHLFSIENGLVLAGGGGLALAVKANDEDLTRHLHDQPALRAASKPGSVIGNAFFQFGVATGVCTVGWVTDNHKVAHIGWDLMRGQIVCHTLTQATKYAVQRQRPDSSGTYSFPSGHASAVFTTASILHQHFGWKVGGPSYVVASYVALSRLPSNRHFLSDVIFGSALGIVVGRSVTFHERHHLAGVQIQPMLYPCGIAVAMRLPPTGSE